MKQDVQDKINALAKKIKGLSVQELHFLSKEVESQRKRQDYEESKWLDTEIKKGDINEFETPDRFFLLWRISFVAHFFNISNSPKLPLR